MSSNISQRIIEVIAIILIGVISVFLLDKNPVVFDLTKNKRYTVDKEIINLLNSIDDNIYVKVFYDRGGRSYNEIEETLRNLSRYSKKIKYSFLDPRRDITLAQLYGFSSSNQILIIYKDRKKFENTIDKEKFANVVSNLLRQKQGKILFTIGHKEPSIDDHDKGGLALLIKSLRDEGLTVENINLAVDNIYDPLALIIIGPKFDFSKEEVDKVRKYLYNGGKVMIAINNYKRNQFSNLDKLVTDFGIRIEEEQLIGVNPDNLAIVPANAVQLPYLSQFSNVNFYLINPVIVNKIDDIKDISLSEVLVAKGILLTKEIMKTKQIIIKSSSIKDYNVSIMAEKIFGDKKANLIVIGDHQMFLNVLINVGENLNFFLAIMDYFSGNENKFVFKPKEVPDIPILIPAYQQLLLYLSYLIIPIAFLLITLSLVYRRRSFRK